MFILFLKSGRQQFIMCLANGSQFFLCMGHKDILTLVSLILVINNEQSIKIGFTSSSNIYFLDLEL